ncbi:MAG: putative 4-mercaptohistidine N1-methyltransferase [Verrucomicrobiia bacterium]
MKPADYDSEALLHQYLLFHFGSATDQFGSHPEPPGGADYPGRCAAAALTLYGPSPPRTALDLGCAVGGATFALARQSLSVLGLDLSDPFISAAEQLRRNGRISLHRVEEGERTTPLEVRLDPQIDRHRTRFMVGDACRLPPEASGPFDLVLAANLIDRLASPQTLLNQAPALVNSGGLLALMSPYTWLESFTPKEAWLGGRIQGHGPTDSFTTLRRILEPAFTLIERRDIPFTIREHARKFQWSIADATFWRRN